MLYASWIHIIGNSFVLYVGRRLISGRWDCAVLPSRTKISQWQAGWWNGSETTLLFAYIMQVCSIHFKCFEDIKSKADCFLIIKQFFIHWLWWTYTYVRG